jgi:hypothetical protein
MFGNIREKMFVEEELNYESYYILTWKNVNYSFYV